MSTSRAGTPALYLLQLKPLIRSEGKAAVDIEGIDRAECFIYSDRSMGNGRDATVSDIVWVDPRRFERSETKAIAAEIEELDKEMRALGRRYVLVGPGRWGTRDRWLGVPVAFTQISMARVIVEADLPEFQGRVLSGIAFLPQRDEHEHRLLHGAVERRRQGRLGLALLRPPGARDGALPQDGTARGARDIDGRSQERRRHTQAPPTRPGAVLRIESAAARAHIYARE